jgi:WS/DGAT/MGAT family acyltransferase
MQQISGLDAAFLFTETPNAPMHIASVGIFDPSTAPGGSVRFKRIIQTVTERAHLAPYLRQRLIEVPFNADFPYWIRDESFDPEFHIRHVALPKPGDWRQLCIQIASLQARSLDRSRPLWELYVIEGLDNVAGIPAGCFALFAKIHHAAIDGATSQAVATALCDPTPEIRQVEGAEQWRADATPSPFELTAMAIEHGVTRPLRYLEFLQKAVPTWTKAVEAAIGGTLTLPPSVPRTRFNRTVSPHRVFEGVTFPLDSIKQIKNDVGGTVNDVVLAICAGALRNYLLENDELPDTSLVSMCPINVRDQSTTEIGGNQVVSMSVPLHTDIADPRERLQAISASTRAAKEYTNAIGAKSMMEMANFIPMELGILGARVAAEQGLANIAAPTFNTVITNVPGSPVPFYSSGARHIRGWGLGPCIDGNGLFHAVGSYCGELNIGVTCCRVMMPDPAHYAELLEESFAALETVTRRQDQPVQTHKKRKRVTKKTGRKAKAQPGTTSARKTGGKRPAAKEAT